MIPEIVNPEFPEVREGATVSVYEQRLLAYIDVLGWSDLVKKSERDPRHLQALSTGTNFLSFPSAVASQTRSFFAEHGPSPFDFEATHFSDSIVLSCSLFSQGSVRSFLSRVQQLCRSLLLSGLYTRGAIVVGLLHHNERSIFGPALIEAHDLERNVAKYPRILVAPAAIPYVDPPVYLGTTETRFFNVRRDADGLTYVDVLGIFGHKNETRRKFGNEERILSATRERLELDADDLGRVAKHSWMIKYLEEVLAECETPDQ